MLNKIKQFNRWYISRYEEVYSDNTSDILLTISFPFIIMLIGIICIIISISTFIGIPFLLLSQFIEYLSDKYLSKYLFNKRKKEFFKWLEEEQLRLDKIRDYEEGEIMFANIPKLQKNNLTPMSVLDLNRNYSTVYVHNNSIIQCRNFKRRSIGDLYRIHKYYDPNTTLKDVLKAYIDAIEDYRIGGCYCNEIKKFVFTDPRHSSTILKDNKTEYKNNPTFQEVIEYFKS